MKENQPWSITEKPGLKKIVPRGFYMMTVVNNEDQRRLHPLKFTLWVAIASILMMFAGLTSAYIVKSNFTGWRTMVLPGIFWVSTLVIVLSSLSMHFALKAFKSSEMQRYRMFLAATLVLGILFLVCQVLGFTELWAQNIKFKGASGAGQFFYAIVGLHALHILGGVVALTVMVVRTLTGKTKSYNRIPVEAMSIYWHFIDILWVYLMFFFFITS